MEDEAALLERRNISWAQTPRTRILDADAAARLIERVGIATLYPVSLEMPNLFHAYCGDPTAKTDSGHDSPSGHVYSWRWVLGRREAAFYSVLVRGRPTWVCWDLLPAVLRLWGDLRQPQELYDRGELSADAYRVARALEAGDDDMSTGDLRQQAGFPTGKPQRAAYLKAVHELDSRLLLAKVFSPDEDDTGMRHALVRRRYPTYVAAAESLTSEGALDAFLTAYLPSAVYAVPTLLAKHPRMPEAALRAGFDRLVGRGQAASLRLAASKDVCYVWKGERHPDMALMQP